MGYFSEIERHWNECLNWLALLKERGGKTGDFEKKISRTLIQWISQLKASSESPELLKEEPGSLKEIRKMRPDGPRSLVKKLKMDELTDKILGAWLGRAAGCILGIPPEGMSKEAIKNACLSLNIPYPLRDYWQKDPKCISPDYLHYKTTARKYFLKKNLSFIGADDDLAYTILGLLILEEYGLGFTTEDVGKAWLRYLPVACTAEKVALENLKKGIPAKKCGAVNNPYADWIGADIRSDPWAYAAPGWPEKAAEFAHRDAFLSHRACGIHGAMFFSAVISAGFVVNDPIEAVRIGLTEIPKKCRLARMVKKTLNWCQKDHNWDITTDRILKKFQGMSVAHTLQNACLTVAGLFYGQGDFEKTITLSVMAGQDTDCNGATAGSILGAILGAKNLPRKWIVPLGDRIETYLKRKTYFSSRDICMRFAKIASRLMETLPNRRC